MFFQSRKQVVVRRGQIQRIGWVIKTLEAQVGQFLLGCKCPVGRGIIVQEQDPLGYLPVAFFLQNVLQLHQQSWQFDPFEDNQWGGCCLDPKRSRRELYQQIFALGIFWGKVSRYVATPLTVALFPGHSDITRFCPWSPITPNRKSLGSSRKNTKSCSDDGHCWCFWSTFRHFGTNFTESFHMSKSSWMMDPTHSSEMPNCSAIDLAKIQRSSKISSWIYQ